MLIIMAGLPGMGKSTVAAELTRRMNAVVLSKDVVRHALFPPELVEYSTEQDDFVIEILLQTAAYIWGRDAEKTIILDGRTFSRESQRKQMIEFAERAKQEWKMVECVCTDEIAKARLRQTDSSHPAGNRTPQLYDEVKARWEPITQEHVTVRTDGQVDYEELVRGLK